MANLLSKAKRIALVSAWIEGNRIRATSRIVGCSNNTATKLLADLGAACSEYQSETLRGLSCKRIQVDEIWSFAATKAETAGNFGHDQEYGAGDVWTFTAIDADTKLVPSWLVASRNASCALEFCQDVADRLTKRIQITSDGHKLYLKAVEGAFDLEVDYSMLQNLYGDNPEPQKRYCQAECKEVRSDVIQSDPAPVHIGKGYSKRQNLPMSMRRFTRLTYAFSKRAENHAHTVSLHFMAYNFVKPHGTLTKAARGTPTTPAMAAGVARAPWTIEQVIGLLRSN